MKKILAILLLIASTIGLFSSCSGRVSDIPDKMQLIDGSAAKGFYFYGPEEWSVSNLGNISAAYASPVDYNSTVTYTEIPMPQIVSATENKAEAISAYFKASLKEFPATVKVSEIVEPKEKFTFGNADLAYDYIYLVTYPDSTPDDGKDDSFTYKIKQVFAIYGDRFGIFTFTSTLTKIGDQTRYEYHAERLKKMTDNFKYVDKTGEAEGAPEYAVGEDGYMMVSKPEVCGFSLFVPESSEVEYSSGIVSVMVAEGAHLSVSKVTGAGTGIGDYIKNNKKDLSLTVSELTDIIAEPKPTTIGNLGTNQAVYTEYTYVFGGVKYHVYQVYAVTMIFGTLAKDGFVFTYTAREDAYSANLDTIMEIAKRVEFK